jgi:hypothetical protein
MIPGFFHEKDLKMATLTADRAASTFPVFQPTGSGVLCAAYGTYALTANVGAADIAKMCKLPAGAVVVGGHLYGADIDTNGTETLDIDVGWAANGGSGTYDSADSDGLGNFGVLTGDAFATGNVSNVTGVHYPLAGLLVTGVLPTFTAETTIQLLFNAVAATFTAGSLSVVVYYVVP